MEKFRNPTSNTKRIPSHYPNIKVRNIQAVAHFGIKSVTYKAIAESQERGEYAMAIQFLFAPALLSKVPVEGYVKAKDEKQGVFYHPQADFNTTPVLIRGSCPDMRFRFSWWLKREKSWIAAVKKYTRVAGSTRPPVNPKEVPGMCKHLTNFMTVLQQNGVIGTLPEFVKP